MVLENTPSFVIENKILKGKQISPPDTGKSLGETLLDNFKKNPDLKALINGNTGEICTNKEFADSSVRCALWLRKQGIKVGDIVTICTYNNIPSWAAFCAVLYNGANVNPWYYDWPPETVRYFLNLIKPKIIFASEEAGKILKRVAREEKFNTKIVIFGKLEGLESYDDIIQQQNSEEVKKFQCNSINPNDDCLLLFSSGSSGLSKGVQHSYQGIYSNTHDWIEWFKEMNGKPIMFSALMYWSTASLTALQCFLSISPAIILRDASPEEFCKAIEKHQVQMIFVGTGTANDVSKSEALHKYDLSSVKIIATGGAASKPEVIKRINQALKNGEVIQAYGTTEIGGAAIAQLKNDKRNYETTGVVFYGKEMKVIDLQTGDILGHDQKGELLFRSKFMMKGYVGNPKATAEAIDADGWYHSGDLGYYDKDGYIYFVGRIKEIIKYRGHQVSPEEVEAVLLRHPQVLEAAVVPVPHSDDDEHPMAFVIKHKNSEVTKDDLLQLTSVLGETKKLRGGIVFLDKFPRIGSGKLDRVKLKEVAKALSE